MMKHLEADTGDRRADLLMPSHQGMQSEVETRPTVVVGWDAASDPADNGVVACEFKRGVDRSVIRILDAWLLDDNWMPQLENLIQCYPKILICIDSPLGWPADFGGAFSHHRAGERVRAARGTFFNRETDRYIIHTTPCKPLNVGANLLGITAFQTLRRVNKLQGLARKKARAISLLTTNRQDFDVGVIEVYPAVTLHANGCRFTGYKGPPRTQPARSTLFEQLQLKYGFDLGERVTLDGLTRIEHIFDALICALTGVDYLNGVCTEPHADIPPEVLAKEGWIWFKTPQRQEPLAR